MEFYYKELYWTKIRFHRFWDDISILSGRVRGEAIEKRKINNFFFWDDWIVCWISWKFSDAKIIKIGKKVYLKKKFYIFRKYNEKFELESKKIIQETCGAKSVLLSKWKTGTSLAVKLWKSQYFFIKQKTKGIYQDKMGI